jgi:hypothetical protein
MRFESNQFRSHPQEFGKKPNDSYSVGFFPLDEIFKYPVVGILE